MSDLGSLLRDLRSTREDATSLRETCEALERTVARVVQELEHRLERPLST